MGRRKRKPRTGFKRYSTLEFIDIVRHAILMMTNNANFTTPNPTLASLATLCDDLAKAELKAKNGGIDLTKAMHVLRDQLEKEFEKLGLYIYVTSNGDDAIMITSGYPLTAEETAPATHPIFWLKHSKNPGEILAFCKAVQKARAYAWFTFEGENLPENDKDWKYHSTTTKAQEVINELTSKVKIWVRVQAITPDGTQPFLDPDCIIVL